MIDILIGITLVTMGYFLGKPSGYVKREFNDTTIEFYGGKFYLMDKRLGDKK